MFAKERKVCGLGGRWGEENVGGVGEGETVIRIMYEKNLNDFINWKERKFHQIFCPSSLQGHLLCLLIDSHYSICSDHIISLISKNRKQNSVPLSPAATITFIFLTAQWPWIWLVLHQSLGNILKNSYEADIKITVNCVLGFSISEGTVPETLSYPTFFPHTRSSFPAPSSISVRFLRKIINLSITSRCRNQIPLFLPSNHAPIVMTLFL